MQQMEQISVIRTEKKFLLPAIQSSRLKNKLMQVMQPDQHSEFGGYLVRSLYFDSFYDDDFYDKVNGMENRKKIRLRTYSSDTQTVKLELKQKQGVAQAKQSLLISKEAAQELVSGNYSVLLTMDGDLPLRLYDIMQNGLYRPKCLVEYKRFAFVEQTNDIRITLDTDIAASEFESDFFSDTTALYPILADPVLEVKYNGFLLSYIKNLLNLADFPQLSISKYELSRQKNYLSY